MNRRIWLPLSVILTQTKTHHQTDVRAVSFEVNETEFESDSASCCGRRWTVLSTSLSLSVLDALRQGSLKRSRVIPLALNGAFGLHQRGGKDDTDLREVSGSCENHNQGCAQSRVGTGHTQTAGDFQG